MKKFMFLLVITLLCLWALPAFALINTRNVEAKDDGTGESGFKYKVAYQFATTDVGYTTTAGTVTTTATGTSYYYTMPFKGNIVGISIASSAATTAGAATAEVTINGCVTGVRTALGTESVKVDRYGQRTTHTTYNYNTINYDNNQPPDWGGLETDASISGDGGYDYGKASPLEAGDYLGVTLELSSTYAPATSSEMVITVIILQ